MCPDGVAGVRVGADEQSLPFVHRDAGGKPGGGDEMAAEHLYEEV